jgi:hypothetical protein
VGVLRVGARYVGAVLLRVGVLRVGARYVGVVLLRVGVTDLVGVRLVGVVRVGVERTGALRTGALRTGALRTGVALLALLVPLLLVAPRVWLSTLSANIPRTVGRRMKMAVLWFMGAPVVGDAVFLRKSDTVDQYDVTIEKIDT